MSSGIASAPKMATVSEIAKWIQFHCKNGKNPGVTFLVGAGFSASAGIPTAGPLIKDTLRPHPLLKDAGEPPSGTSEYAYLMSKLPATERTTIIRDAIKKAEDDTSGRLKINWAHLLLATLVDAGYINRILTTNFDPLIVDSLSLTSQPVRSFDLTASAGFQPGLLEPGSIIYLHGQAHGLWLSNSSDEMNRVRKHLKSVFHDALRESILIVIGYSGACDPVLQELTSSFPQFSHRLYWIHHDPSTDPDTGAMELLTDHYREAFLIKGFDADAFMRELVLEELKIDLPLIVKTPLDSIAQALKQIMPFPQRPNAPTAPDPVQSAEKLVLEAQECIKNPKTMDKSLLSIAISMASATKSRSKLKALQKEVVEADDKKLSAELGRAYLTLASNEVGKGNFNQIIADLELAEKIGTQEKCWISTIWGNALSEQAKTKNGVEADDLFRQAGEKYVEALKIKSDMHEALCNWGFVLYNQAKTKSGAEADSLFKLAGEKFSEALKIQPDMHEAMFNWGLALSARARTKSGTEADSLFKLAGEKYAEALRIKPDMHDALYDWGDVLYDQAETKSGAEADSLFKRAGEKYAEALRIRPDNHDSLLNWGNALTAQAKIKRGTEADSLFKLAGEKYAEALKIQPDKHEALCNWGCALTEQAEIKSGVEADSLFKLAGEKFAEALKIKPDDHETLLRWGFALSNWARTKSGTEADNLFRRAAEKYAEALRIKPDYESAQFNTACLHALRGEVDLSIQWLQRWVKENPKASKSQIEKDHDFAQIRDTKEFREFMASLK